MEPPQGWRGARVNQEPALFVYADIEEWERAMVQAVDQILNALTRKIAGKLNSNESCHPEDGFQLDITLLRSMGTWCTPEVNKARARGYILVRIHEVWHFTQSEEGLFADYVNTWLKIKQEASGQPFLKLAKK